MTSAGLVVVAGGITKASSPGYLASAEKSSPVAVASFEEGYWADTATTYSFGPQVNPPDDPHVGDRATEIKGTLYHPTIASGVAYPVIVMLHGNHASCGQNSGVPRIDDDNSYAGVGGVDNGGWCPGGYSEVRQDKGYAYVAHELAQRGFIVASINANRGIANRDDGAGDGHLIDTRGRLVLKTLQYMHRWNTIAGESMNAGLPNLVGHLNLGNVGLVGHSRGGEGVRAAARFFADQAEWQAAIPPLHIHGIFEIGSTDSGSQYDIGSIPWALLQGTCDTNAKWYPGTNGPSGLRAFDRWIANGTGFVGEYVPWGANPNFYNTEWQTSDVEFDAFGNPGTANQSCLPAPIYQVGGKNSGIKGSARQRQTAVHTIVAFMQGVLLGDTSKFSVFDSAVPAPPAIRVTRAHQMNEGGRITLEDFLKPNSGSTTAPSLFGNTNSWSSSLTVQQATSGEAGEFYGQHEGNGAAFVKWTSNASSRMYQLKWANSGSGFDFTSKTYFEVRVDRDPTDPNSAATDFGVRLLRSTGASTTVPISSYTSLIGPPGIMTTDDINQPFLSRTYAMGTVRIPLSAFGGTNNNVHGMEFVINPNTSGKIFLSNVRLTAW